MNHWFKKPRLLVQAISLDWVLAFFVIIVACFLLLYKINSAPLCNWDESLYGIMSVDLAEQNQLTPIWHDFLGEGVDLYDTKPRFLYYWQAFTLKQFGWENHLLALRIHSVVASFLLLLSMLFWSQKILSSIWYGVLSVLAMVTLRAFMINHVARTGDFDSLLLLFNTNALFAFYYYITTDKKHYVLLVGFFLALAVVSKSAAGFLFIPSVFIFTLFKWKLGKVLCDKYFYWAIVLFLFLVLAYYLFEELKSPGYLRQIWLIDMKGRYGQVTHYNEHPVYFYFRYLFTHFHFSPWITYVPLAVLLILAVKQKLITDFLIFIGLVSLTYILVISFSETKIYHYLAPVYPLLAFVVAFPIFLFTNYLKAISKNQGLQFLLLLAGIAMFFSIPGLNIVQDINKTAAPGKIGTSNYDMYYELFDDIKTQYPQITSITVYRPDSYDWSPQLVFYQKMFHYAYNYSISVVKDTAKLDSAQYVVSNIEFLEMFESQYPIEVLAQTPKLFFGSKQKDISKSCSME